ncbi:bifunctional nicotinamidase/pyrazinamidase [Xenorhabdus budapestensis]|uniref:Nicotinamidase n=1 Tax=Xenorhabdus budapestensis TaxID=290110 RepID=A0A2D0J2L4_XENBU|nr:bifunctional nicotinamidase/pyrazinamidase [Xenorhabdus budapestensis]PHM28626.1 pyrazinamidase/nicotinamidase [Xenorhabdus budapestensis]QTL41509.1 bifunctional nicotinamidase/pyrazinamidase [Xenorhabdus budapestensis]
MKTALLLIDLQNDFCTSGTLAVKESEEVIEMANKAIELCQQHNITIIATQDWHPSDHMSFAVNSGQLVGELGELNGIPQIWWPVHCVQGQLGADFHPALNQSAIQKIFRKGENSQIDSYSAFFDNDHKNATRLHGWLSEQHINRLLILGIATDYCVKFTVLDALAHGYETYVIVEGCRGVNIQADDSQRAIEEMTAKGAKLTSLNEITTLF